MQQGAAVVTLRYCFYFWEKKLKMRPDAIKRDPEWLTNIPVAVHLRGHEVAMESKK